MPFPCFLGGVSPVHLRHTALQILQKCGCVVCQAFRRNMGSEHIPSNRSSLSLGSSYNFTPTVNITTTILATDAFVIFGAYTTGKPAISNRFHSCLPIIQNWLLSFSAINSALLSIGKVPSTLIIGQDIEGSQISTVFSSLDLTKSKNAFSFRINLRLQAFYLRICCMTVHKLF